MLNYTDIKMTDRDRQVLELLANESMSNKEIAEQLGISHRTVKGHLFRLYVRTGVEGRKRVALAAMFRPPTDTKPTKAELTEREWEIAIMAADGMGNSTIAEKAGTTVNVVKNHMRSIYDKAGVWTRLELAAWVDAHTNHPPLEANGQ